MANKLEGVEAGRKSTDALAEAIEYFEQEDPASGMDVCELIGMSKLDRQQFALVLAAARRAMATAPAHAALIADLRASLDYMADPTPQHASALFRRCLAALESAPKAEPVAQDNSPAAAMKRIAARILERVAMIPEAGCWIWLGSTNQKGYGFIREGGKNVLTHRASYAAMVGPIPDGLWVLHRCDVPSCVNPAHLFVGTRQDNMIDCGQKKRNALQIDPSKSFFATPEGKKRRAKGERHGSAKITSEQAIEIRTRLLAGQRQAAIARSIGCSEDIVGHIKRGTTWTHLP